MERTHSALQRGAGADRRRVRVYVEILDAAGKVSTRRSATFRVADGEPFESWEVYLERIQRALTA